MQFSVVLRSTFLVGVLKGMQSMYSKLNWQVYGFEILAVGSMEYFIFLP